ncbi:MAG: flagellar hook-associated protein FlgK [Pseudomonadota bacterium]
MSSLTTVLNIATSSLSTTSTDSSVVARNIARAGDPNASAKVMGRYTTFDGGVRPAGINRLADAALFESAIGASTSSSASQARLDALNQLYATVSDPELELSPSGKLAALNSALQDYASAPQNPATGQAVVTAASEMVMTLNSATDVTRQVRWGADQGIADAVDSLNRLLGDFDETNEAIMRGMVLGRDVTDLLDQRDTQLRAISGLIDIRTIERDNGDMVIFAGDSLTLYESGPRDVTFTLSTPLADGAIGNDVSIDGIPVSTSGLGNGVGGQIGALLSIRDETSITYQRQLDEIARGLIEVFAETDQSAVPTLTDQVGLFIYSGGPAVPPSGTVVDGLAGQISVNPAADPSQGGSIALLRDGGFSGASYIENTAANEGFSDRLLSYAEALSADRSFDSSADIESTVSVLAYASASAAWLAEERTVASVAAESAEIQRDRTNEAWHNAVGVNIDKEMTTLLDLERSYQASSRLISTVDAMFNALLQATG